MSSRRPKFTVDDVLMIAARDQYRCLVCGEGYDPARPWQIDHDIAIKRGGRHVASNLRLTHRDCNVFKGTA